MAIVISGVNNNDKITATDGTIDLLSSASLSGILTAPAFSATGNITAGHIDIGPGISLGQSGVATATTFVGNLTGNVNATSNLLLQIGGSEKFRVGGSGQLGIGGANYGTSGQVLTSGGSGSAVSWSTISVPPATTINNNAGNKVITGSGSANTLEAENKLRWDGTNFLIGTTTEDPYGNRILVVANDSASGTDAVCIEVRSPESGTGRIIFTDNTTSGNTGSYKGNIIYQQSDDKLFFGTNGAYGHMYIDSNGHFLPNTNNSKDLGSTSLRWRNIYTQDLQLSNEAVGDNGIDGTWGNYTIVEGESDLFLKNNRSGKTYKFNLTEVS